MADLRRNQFDESVLWKKKKNKALFAAVGISSDPLNRVTY
jgi:hypothetical protein